MPKGTNEPPTPFALAVHAEIRAWQGRRNLSQRQLATLADLKQANLSNMIGSNKKSLNLNELEALCDALDVDVRDIINAAKRNEHLYAEPQDDYALAAKIVDSREGEDGIEYFEG
ncbi:helix-turn-helix domain-containing protein [Rothia nasimurium]|uniref:helix-turn-helix domain-containing protein n=1 Tax=Rothia nasimurium TaxID=85336 RepID=UPI001F2905E4|nr:helix-turn-helix transcriptional regulator [Rothia nasimurium]